MADALPWPTACNGSAQAGRVKEESALVDQPVPSPSSQACKNQSSTGHEAQMSYFSLPRDMRWAILEMLPVKDLISWPRVCKAARADLAASQIAIKRLQKSYPGTSIDAFNSLLSALEGLIQLGLLEPLLRRLGTAATLKALDEEFPKALESAEIGPIVRASPKPKEDADRWEITHNATHIATFTVEIPYFMPAFYIEVTILEAPVEYPEVGVGYVKGYKSGIEYAKFVGWYGRSMAFHGDNGQLYTGAGGGSRFNRGWPVGSTGGVGVFIAPFPYMADLDHNEPSEWGSDYYGHRDEQSFLSEPAPSYMWVTRKGELLNDAPALHFHHPLRNVCGAISVRHSVRLRINIGREPFHNTDLPSFSVMRGKLTAPSIRQLYTTTPTELVRMMLRRTALRLEFWNAVVAVYLLREALRLAGNSMSNDRVDIGFELMALLARTGRWHEAIAEGRWITDEIFNPLTVHRWMQKRMEIRDPVMSYARALAKAGLKDVQRKFLALPAPKQLLKVHRKELEEVTSDLSPRYRRPFLLPKQLPLEVTPAEKLLAAGKCINLAVSDPSFAVTAKFALFPFFPCATTSGSMSFTRLLCPSCVVTCYTGSTVLAPGYDLCTPNRCACLQFDICQCIDGQEQP